MNLPFFKSKPRTPLREYLYALEINHHSVQSAIWTVANGKPQVVATGVPTEWDDASESELIAACDQSISDCTAKFDPTGRVQPEKVIIGLPSDWVSSEKITTTQLRQLKHVSEKLSLAAVGFVVIPEAVTRYIQSQEGAPPTAILIGVSPHHLEVTLIKLGKVLGSQLVARSSHIAADTIEGLSRFTSTDMLPSRMLVYGIKSHLEDIRQALLAHAWQAPQTKLPFLHFPKIEILSPEFSVHAIALAGGSEVAVAIGLASSEPVIEPEVITPPQIIPELASLEDLGFTTNDIIDPSPPIHQALAVPDYDPSEAEESIPDEVPEPRSHSVHRKLPSFSLPSIGAKLPILLGLATIFLVVALGLAYWYLPKATVTLTLNPKTLQDQFDLISDTALSAPDLSKPAIPASSKSVSIDESATVDATGTKLIGDKAIGTVTIINGTPVAKKFPAGTSILSSTNLKFLLDKDIEVASAAGSADPNSYQPGKADTKITAAAIGTDSNLTAGTQFKIGSFSSLDFVAKNEAAFSGGTSRQVKAISKDDYAKLRSLVESSAKEKATTQFLSELTDTQIVVEQSIRLSTVSEDFNHKIDETADNVSLKLTIKATGLILSKSDILSLINDKLKPQLSSGYKSVGEPTYDFSVKSVDKTIATLSVSSKLSALPEIDEQSLRSSLTGKKSQPAFDYLQSLPGVAQVDISYWPPLPTFIRTLPRVSKNINFVILSK